MRNIEIAPSAPKKTIEHICHTCNGEGITGGCPKCGLTPRTVVASKVKEMIMPSEIIPPQYQGVAWQKPAPTKCLRFNSFDNKLEAIYNTFLKGNIPAYSLFISSPAKSGKNNFGYGCMQTALAQGHSVAPMLSTADWRRLYKISQMTPMYKLYGKFKWDTLVMHEVVFITIEHSEDHFEDVPLLKNILDLRASFGLATFILSDYKLNQLTTRWNSDAYTMIYNPVDRRDVLRYPVVLHRFE